MPPRPRGGISKPISSALRQRAGRTSMMTRDPTTCPRTCAARSPRPSCRSCAEWAHRPRHLAGHLPVRAPAQHAGPADRAAPDRRMSAQSVRAWLAEHAPDLRLIEVEDSTATVETAAKALGAEPGRIAKTLAVRAGDHLFLLVARGDARLDNRKCKDEFGARPRMLGSEETLEVTGHPVGGVCPFGLKSPLPIYLDVSLQAFDVVYPAGGSLNTSVEVKTERLFDLVGERWVDLCRLSAEAGGV